MQLVPIIEALPELPTVYSMAGNQQGIL